MNILNQSRRNINRLVNKYREEGKSGFIHKNKGKENKNKRYRTASTGYITRIRPFRWNFVCRQNYSRNTRNCVLTRVIYYLEQKGEYRV